MKENQQGIFQMKENKDGQRFWNRIPVEISGDSRFEIKGKNFNITPNLQNVFTDTTGKSLKKLDNTENITYKKLLKTPISENYKLKSEEVNSGRNKKIPKLSSSLSIYKVRGLKKSSFHQT